jgi:hypothetical protein
MSSLVLEVSKASQHDGNGQSLICGCFPIKEKWRFMLHSLLETKRVNGIQGLSCFFLFSIMLSLFYHLKKQKQRNVVFYLCFSHDQRAPIFPGVGDDQPPFDELHILVASLAA